MNRLRWLVLLLGPLPIIGSSWAVSAWLKSPRAVVEPNHVVPPQGSELNRSVGMGRVPGTPPQSLVQACETSAARLRDTLGSECEVIVRAPLVLAGDLPPGRLATLHTETIVPAMQALDACYFDAAPDQVVTVLAFSGEQSYNRHCEELFGDGGISIYGYYKPNVRTLVLNLGTGTGTLLHELTHALLAFDFPQAPDWLNEGLASLHEQSRFRSDATGPWIEGLVNWRLPALQEVVRHGQLASLRQLAENPRFRGAKVGTNYAHARYLCLYLQQRGVLADFYRCFRDNHATEPRGLSALARVFPEVSLDELDRDFKAWVLTLSDPDEQTARRE